MGLYERIVNPSLLTRRITLTANHLKDADKVKDEPVYEQLDLFSGGLLICFLLLSSRGELHFYLFFCAFAGFLLQYAAMRPIISCIVGFFSRVLQKRRESRHEKRQRTEDKQ